MSAKILILEDDNRMRRLLELILREPGYKVRTAVDGITGVALWKNWLPDLVLSDMKMPHMDGLEVLRFRNNHFPDTPFILLTAFGTVETAVAAMKDGAFDYLTKPVDNNQMLKLVAKGLDETKKYVPADSRMIGSSPALQKVRQSIAMLAETESSVMITGESGTGKDLVARAIHLAYSGPKSPYVQVNCPAIPKDLLESELFGHRRGAFTGAVEDRKGAFVLANGGTLFLDEIGNLPLELQPKLLHAVEQKMVTLVGGSKPCSVCLKIISATNCDMAVMVERGTFRQDLFFRLNTLQIHLPPLRDRREDIRELTDYYLTKFARKYKKKTLLLDEDAFSLMQKHHWPGNIRELRNVLESGCLRCKGDTFTASLFPHAMRNTNQSENNCLEQKSQLDLVEQERDFIVQALNHCYWNQSRAAKRLGITRNTLRYRIKKYEIKKQ